MWLKCRILFTILSVICVACVLPMGALLNWTWAGIAALSAFVFYGLMLICKNNQPEPKKEQPKDEENKQE